MHDVTGVVLTPIAISPLRQGLHCVRGDRQSVACILYSHHTSLCVPVFQIHHTSAGPSSPPCSCLCARHRASTLKSFAGPCIMSHRCSRPPSPSRLFAKAYTACEATDRTWHAYCTAITPQFACHRVSCILYSYHTSLCVPVFQIHHTSACPSSPPCSCLCA